MPEKTPGNVRQPQPVRDRLDVPIKDMLVPDRTGLQLRSVLLDSLSLSAKRGMRVTADFFAVKSKVVRAHSSAARAIAMAAFDRTSRVERDLPIIRLLAAPIRTLRRSTAL